MENGEKKEKGVGHVVVMFSRSRDKTSWTTKNFNPAIHAE